MKAFRWSWLGLVGAVACGGTVGPGSAAENEGGAPAEAGSPTSGLEGGTAEGTVGPSEAGLADRVAADSGAADGGATEGGIVAACRLGESCSESGELCSMVGCMAGQTCVCDQGLWSCPECAHVSCPPAQPADGSACFNPGTSCPYPGSSVDCQCSGNSAGPYAWHCSAGTLCPALPPTGGGSCSSGLDCSYTGGMWGMDCPCNGSSWACTMQSCAASAGAACPGVPRGVQCFLPNGTNAYEGCTCAGSSSPAWRCTAIDCPSHAPMPGSACPHSAMACAYGGSTCVCTPGLTWSC